MKKIVLDQKPESYISLKDVPADAIIIAIPKTNYDNLATLIKASKHNSFFNVVNGNTLNDTFSIEEHIHLYHFYTTSITEFESVISNSLK